MAVVKSMTTLFLAIGLFEISSNSPPSTCPVPKTIWGIGSFPADRHPDIKTN
jgi:hypothetical protein